MKVLPVILLLFFEVYSISGKTGPLKLNLVSRRLLDGLLDGLGFLAYRDVSFTLYTRSCSNQVIGLNDTKSLMTSNFNSSHPIRFVIHGWVNNDNSEINKLITSAYHSVGDFNVFIVDWGAFDEYSRAASQVDPVGETVADFLIFLRKETGIRLSDVTVIGHSMGAHIAGVTGRNTAKVEELGVIVGLDPALPMFDTKFSASRLTGSDAKYVETMHTNIYSWGIGPPIGTASFYPNYGKKQPGCILDIIQVCSHNQAYKYFAESITSKKGFWARRCQGYDDITKKSCISSGEDVLMGGEPSNVKSEGVYWLKTNMFPPFAKGELV
ncbi:phospholipase A1-like [Sergentomyia squamirostris]